MMTGFGWAKHPMLNRMGDLRADKPLTVLYGSRSWIDQSNWDLLKLARDDVVVQVKALFYYLFLSFINHGNCVKKRTNSFSYIIIKTYNFQNDPCY